MPPKKPTPPQGLCFVEVESFLTPGLRFFVNPASIQDVGDHGHGGVHLSFIGDPGSPARITGTAREFCFRAADSVALLENNAFRVEPLVIEPAAADGTDLPGQVIADFAAPVHPADIGRRVDEDQK